LSPAPNPVTQINRLTPISCIAATKMRVASENKRIGLKIVAGPAATPSVWLTASTPSTALAGRPDEGIAAGTRWAEIPDDWACPDCGVAKGDFEMVELVAA
jgi:rubredoxin